MSLDGFSMSAMGLPKDITSAQAAATAEHIANTGNDKVVGKIDKALNKKINNDEEKERKNQYFNDGFQEDEEDENEDEENTEEGEINKDEKFSSNYVKKYKSFLLKDPENVSIRINQRTNRIELFNKMTQKVVESISAEDFLDMINKLDYNSGIMVNRKV